jgi:hypothetical protein
MRVQWWPHATLALLNMPRDQAISIDRAVQRLASTGEGIAHASDEGVFFLYVGAYVVEFLFDDSTDTIHVVRVRRA